MLENRQATVFEKLITDQKHGEASGVYSVCSAEPFVLKAAFHTAQEDNSTLLVESTCNQVNQFGGYTGMTPADFNAYVQGIASVVGFPISRLTLGGDHLGPSPWQSEPSKVAMDKAQELVAEYVKAGFTKIHLDASMTLGDDPRGQVDIEVAARRTADLCKTAEKVIGESPTPLHYVIGTEVPPPGGAKESANELCVTQLDRVQETIEITKKTFLDQGLGDAWERVIAIVVQPGVEFSDQAVFDYRPELTRDLSHFIESYDHLVYEAHSTDYQLPARLKQLVVDHFAILKVGPALTFALREAVFALAYIELETLSKNSHVRLSQILDALENAMLNNPKYWHAYYGGTLHELNLALKYSYSDRIRYYWTDPNVQASLQQLLQNLEDYPPPYSLISQYLPNQYRKLRMGQLDYSPRAFIQDKIQDILENYSYACGFR